MGRAMLVHRHNYMRTHPGRLRCPRLSRLWGFIPATRWPPPPPPFPLHTLRSTLCPPKAVDKTSFTLLVETVIRTSFGAVGWGLCPVEVASVAQAAAPVAATPAAATSVYHSTLVVPKR